jgi:hypothetical protein
LRTLEVRLQTYFPKTVEVPLVRFGDAGEDEGDEAQEEEAGKAQGSDAPVPMETGGGKGEEEGTDTGATADDEASEVPATGPEVGVGGGQGRKRKLRPEVDAGSRTCVYGRANALMRGHTAFLTFATAGLIPPAAKGQASGAQSGGGEEEGGKEGAEEEGGRSAQAAED